MGSFRRLTLALVVAATIPVVSLSSPAWGAGPEDAAASEARKHYEEGTKAFNLGEFARAIAEFKATYNAKPDPLLLYNIAQSYRLGGDAAQAVFFYKSFLRNMPDATNRKEVEAHIRKLEKQLEDQKRDPGPRATGATSPGSTPGPLVPGATAPGSLTPETPSSGTSSPSLSGSRPTGAAPDSPPAMRPPPPAIPPPSTSQAGAVDLTTPATPAEPADRPIYKKWWFWVGAAGAVVIIGGIAAASAKKEPSTVLGIYQPRWVP